MQLPKLLKVQTKKEPVSTIYRLFLYSDVEIKAV
ncbi:hypothetical protein DET48_10135 [Vibrio diazotrophicus]|uniref:Uncharacterized protein n=1 Tax=Vibrio diazotrophicus TaxID=685 RepID=A0A329EEF2_VIBDI|nr:hypothetical protein DET48_10135 [Vibrio diazotrophicus]